MRRTLFLLPIVAVVLHGFGPMLGSPAAAQERFAGSARIWSGERVQRDDLVYFRSTFTLPGRVKEGSLHVRTSNPYTIFLNGASVLIGTGSPEASAPAGRFLRAGRNVLAIQCSRSSEEGILYELSVTLTDGRRARVLSSSAARARKLFEPGWQTVSYDDSKWPFALNIGRSLPTPQAPSTPIQIAPQPGPPQIRPNSFQTDAKRLVRIWDSGVGRSFGSAAKPGERIVLASNAPPAGDVPLLQLLGISLVQSDGEALGTNEVQSGQWDYRRAESEVRLAKASGFQWSFFPQYAFPPKWYADQIRFARATALETGKSVRAFSPWEPKFTEYASRALNVLADRFRAPNAIDTLVLGIHGDYGEAGLLNGGRMADPAQREDWIRRFGDSNNQRAWWCADPLARANFRDAMVAKYGSFEALNETWKSNFARPQDIAYPASPQQPSRRAWIDFVDWYTGSVAQLTERLMSTAKAKLPNVPITVLLGQADENPRLGADPSLLVKTIGHAGGVVRSTHGGFKPFAQNQATLQGRIASACKLYGVPFWTEATGRLKEASTASRLFTAISVGATGLYDWVDNIREGREAYLRFGRHLRASESIVDVAMFYPSASMKLRSDSGTPQTFAKGCAEIRDILNYDILDERMIADGALDRYRILVLWEGVVVEADTLKRVRDWVERGGVVTGYDFGKIETVEGDRGWFAEVFGGRDRAAGSTVRYIPSGNGGLPARYRLAVTETGASVFLGGDWFETEVVQEAPVRWTGAAADIRVPVDSSRTYTLTIKVDFPQEAARLSREILINGQRLGAIEQPGEQTFTIPLGALRGRDLAILSFRGETWTPSGMLKGTTDKRALGISVEWLELDSSGQARTAPAPPLPQGRFDTTIDLRRLRNEWAKQLGNGWTVYYPATRSHLSGYYEVIRYLAYHLSDLDPTKQGAIPVDDAWDGIYGTLLGDRAVYFNPRGAPFQRTVVLPPASFEGKTGVKTPAAFTHSISVEPSGIGSINFEPAPLELLLQCEKFLELGSLRPLTNDALSPGQGTTHILIPRGGQITTRFQCDMPGKYKVIYHAVRRGAQASAEIEVDGRRLDAPAGQAGKGAITLAAGSIDLTAGVHSLTLRPRAGEDVRADFVVLTNDPAVVGYGFAPRE